MDIKRIADFIETEAMTDPEFKRAMRYFSGDLAITVDGDSAVFTFEDGLMVGPSTARPEAAAIIVSGTQNHWDEMLAEYPLPFFQCLQTTSIKHGLSLNNTAVFYAYLPALNRLVSLLRSANVKEGVTV